MMTTVTRSFWTTCPVCSTRREIDVTIDRNKLEARTKKAEARFKLTGIRCERVCDVNDIDAALEGIQYDPDRKALVYGGAELKGATASQAYLWLWSQLYPKSDLTELCWVLEIGEVIDDV